MSRKKESKVKNFLVQEGYLLAFTFVCALGLFSYFYVAKYFESDSTEVLGTSSVRGVWVQPEVEEKCTAIDLVDVDGCIDTEYFNDFNVLNSQDISLNSEGKIVFSNNDLFVSGIFDTRDVVDDEVWSNMYIGDLNLKINNKQWVFEDIVWDRDGSDPLISLVMVDSGYLIIFHPSVVLTGRTKQFWVFEYVSGSDSIKSLSFSDDVGKRAFLESSEVVVLEKGSDVFLRFDRYDPSLMGDVEVSLYRFSSNLELFKRFLLNLE